MDASAVKDSVHCNIAVEWLKEKEVWIWCFLMGWSGVVLRHTPSRERSHITQKWHFADDFPFSQVGYGIVPWRVRRILFFGPCFGHIIKHWGAVTPIPNNIEDTKKQ